MGERDVRNVEASGSIPLTSTIFQLHAFHALPDKRSWQGRPEWRVAVRIGFVGENLALISKQEGFISGSIMTLLIGGLALLGLLAYGLRSGQELPLWPALAVALVNVVAAAKIVVDIKKAKQQRQAPSSATAKSNPRRG